MWRKALGIIMHLVLTVNTWNLVCLICVIMITIHYSLLTNFGLCGFLEQSLFYYTFANNHSLCSVNSFVIVTIVLCVIFIFSHMFYSVVCSSRHSMV